MFESGCVGPFSEGGLDVAIGLRRIGLDLDVLDAELLASAREGFRVVAAAIVGHDALDGDAEGFVVGDGGEQEGNGTLLFLIGEDIGKGDAGMIVDGDMDALPAGPLATAMSGAPPGDAMSDAVEAAELFDSEMNDLTRLLTLVAWARRLRLQRREQAQPAALEDARDGGFGDAEFGSDVLLGVTFPAQSLDRCDRGCGLLAWR